MSRDITRLLNEIREGDRTALDELFAVLHRELRTIAEHRVRGERPGNTLQPSDLVQEAYLRIVQDNERNQLDFESRARFFAFASEKIRRVLVDHARTRATEKRGAGKRRIPLESDVLRGTGPPIDILALDEALAELSKLDERQTRIVEMRFFAGLTVPEVAAVLDVSPRTVEGDWTMARSWLRRRLESA